MRGFLTEAGKWIGVLPEPGNPEVDARRALFVAGLLVLSAGLTIVDDGKPGMSAREALPVGLMTLGVLRLIFGFFIGAFNPPHDDDKSKKR